MKKYKVPIPEGYEVDELRSSCLINELVNGDKVITIICKPIKKELPKTWDEYWNMNEVPLRYKINYGAEFEALKKLLELRDHYNDGWKPDWNEENTKYTITNTRNKIDKSHSIYGNYILTFKTHELRVEFLSNFAQLIEEAKPLL